MQAGMSHVRYSEAGVHAQFWANFDDDDDATFLILNKASDNRAFQVRFGHRRQGPSPRQRH